VARKCASNRVRVKKVATAPVIDGNGTRLGLQHKVQIDPSEEATYVSGAARQVFRMGPLIFGTVICHEGWRYPETVRWSVRNGAQVVFHPQFHEAEPSGFSPSVYAEPRTLAGQIRQHFYKITLPWSDEGFRFLLSNFYFDLMQRMREFEAGFEQGVESSLRVYPQYIGQVRPELNGLFCEEDHVSYHAVDCVGHPRNRTRVEKVIPGWRLNEGINVFDPAGDEEVVQWLAEKHGASSRPGSGAF
jgi:hypothetical protein